MVFPTIEFAVFFPPVLALSWALMSRPRIWKPFILFCSYVFYAAANPKFCLLLVGVTLGNQLFATLITRTDKERLKNWLCGMAVVLDLGVLAVFKYYSFFVQGVDDAFHLASPLPQIALPVGLSFFTCQGISSAVDVRPGLC